MKNILIALVVLVFSLGCKAEEKSTVSVNLSKLNEALSKLHEEIKCPGFPKANLLNMGITACLRLLDYDTDKNRILFVYTVYKNSEFLEGFSELSTEHERKKAVISALKYLSAYTGVTPTYVNSDKYYGKIQTTPFSHIFNRELSKKERALKDFIRDNSIVGVRYHDDKQKRYVALLDENREIHYQEGLGVSLTRLENSLKKSN